jgi:hypothetical protein
MYLFETSEWSEAVFQEFVEFKNRLHHDVPSSFSETVEDYKKYFSKESAFSDFNWILFRIVLEGRPLAQAILCWKSGSMNGNLGFLDWENNETAARALIQRVKSRAREVGLKNIKTPVDLNFFIKYRIRTPGGKSPYYGEPIYPDYYHDLFKASDLKVVGQWDTYEVDRKLGQKHFFKKRRKSLKSEGPKSNVRVRSIDIRNWEQELKIIFDLFSGSYKSMPEFEPLSFEQFKSVYGDFRYIVQPWLSYIVEKDGRPIGLSINFMDPLAILKNLEGKKLGPLGKLLVMAKIWSNRGTFIIAHVGKIEDIPGLQYRVSRRIAIFSLIAKKVIVTFQNTESPSRRSWAPEVLLPYASYVLYGTDLE